MQRFSIQLLDKSHDRAGFDCGVLLLNNYLKTSARQAQVKNFNRTYVAIEEGDPKKSVKGYYSISMGQVDLSSLPTNVRQGLPKHPVPVGRMGRLAVDLSTKGKGLGKELLVDALKRIKAVSGDIGIFAVIVDAKDESAKSFYEKYGFIPLADDPLALYLPISSIP